MNQTLLGMGGILTAITLVFAYMRVNEYRERRRHARLGVTACAAITRPLSGLCAVEGQVRPGPAGELTAPLSGQRCAWYWTRIQATVRGGSARPIAWQIGGDMPFAVRDETGVVLIDPRMLDPANETRRQDHRPPGELVVTESTRKISDSVHVPHLAAQGLLPPESLRHIHSFKRVNYWYVQESVLPIGEPVHVQGAPRYRGGRLMIGPWHKKHLITTSHAEHAARVDYYLRQKPWILMITATAAAVLLLAGLLSQG